MYLKRVHRGPSSRFAFSKGLCGLKYDSGNALGVHMTAYDHG